MAMLELLTLGMIVALRSMGGAVAHVIRHERARRAAAQIVFPPLTTIAVSDEIPWD